MDTTKENKLKDVKLRDRTLALAGVFQAAALVKQLAKTGRSTEPYFTHSIESLFKINAVDVPDVYGGIQSLQLGLKELIRLFINNKDPKDADIARYVLSLLHLERKLSKNAEMNALVQKGLERAKIQAGHFNSTHENVIANLASIYTDTLSNFKFRVYVSGEPLYLNQTYIVNKVRSLLFAGIRSSVLWHQLGGRRWQLLISRLGIIQTAKGLLREIEVVEEV
jgi:high frequency lysogenization protein